MLHDFLIHPTQKCDSIINWSKYKTEIVINSTLQCIRKKLSEMKLVGKFLLIFCGINPCLGIFFSPDGPDLVEKNVKIYFS